MAQKCKVCGKSADSEYCFRHKPPKKLRSVTTGGRSGGRSYGKNAMREFFLRIWKKRKHYSEVSGEYLGKEASSGYFHHILEKNKYPELAYNEDNIILLTLDEHANVESNIYRYDEVNIRREQLKTQYNIL